MEYLKIIFFEFFFDQKLLNEILLNLRFELFAGLLKVNQIPCDVLDLHEKIQMLI